MYVPFDLNFVHKLSSPLTSFFFWTPLTRIDLGFWQKHWTSYNSRCTVSLSLASTVSYPPSIWIRWGFSPRETRIYPPLISTWSRCVTPKCSNVRCCWYAEPKALRRNDKHLAYEKKNINHSLHFTRAIVSDPFSALLKAFIQPASYHPLDALALFDSGLTRTCYFEVKVSPPTCESWLSWSHFECWLWREAEPYGGAVHLIFLTEDQRNIPISPTPYFDGCCSRERAMPVTTTSLSIT